MGVVGSATDVTERVRAEAELRARERELATLTDHAPDILVRFDRELRHLFISPAVEVSTGLPPEHYLGKTNRELGMPEHLCRLWERELRMVFESGEPRRFAFELPGASGSRWFEASVVPELGADGSVETVLSATRDSTEMRRAEEERAASEGRYRDLFERAMDMIFAFDRDGRFTDVNPAVERVLGYARSELIGRHYSTVMPEDEVLRASERLRRKLAGVDRATAYEAALRHKDGREVAVEVRSQTLPGSDGPAGVVTILRDITAERSARRALEESERRFRGAFDDAAVGMVLTDNGGRILRVNRVFADMLGHHPDELHGRPIQEFTHPDDRQEVAADVQLMIAGLKDRRIADKRYVRSDGGLVHAHIGVSPVRDEDGAVVMFIAQVEDVTELRRVQAELADSERMLGSILDTTPDVVALWDLDFRITFINPAIEAQAGIAPSDAVGRRAHEFGSLQADFWEQQFREVVATGEARSISFPFPHPDGERYFDLVASPRRGADGSVTGIVTVARNVTERVRLEERLRQAARMEALGRLSGGVAHDFNNLLVAIRGYSDLALQRLDGTGDENVRGAVAEIRRAGDRAAELVRQLLAFSRQQVLRPEVTSLNEVVSDYAMMLRRLVGEDVEVVLELDPALPLVRIDHGQFGQVLLNLAVNARDAMPEGGRLTIATDAPAYGADDEREVRVRVSDTGVGIPPEDRDRIFDPFFTTKDAEKGTGLGLATVLGIVEQSGGRIQVESEPGSGSTFEILLRASDQRPPRRDEEPDRPSVGAGETVLVVEDERIVRDLVKEMLERANYRVVSAARPSEALELAAADETVSLMLVDVVMPEMSGPMLADKVRAFRPGLPVVFTSGYTSDMVVERGVLEDAEHYLQKPFGVPELTAAVAAALAA
ncbi:MAG: PAS domain S-box protein [Actinobacteria bacterium]|nr:PAS domain S-box protein [Actinomycetota bacterium]